MRPSVQRFAPLGTQHRVDVTGELPAFPNYETARAFADQWHAEQVRAGLAPSWMASPAERMTPENAQQALFGQWPWAVRLYLEGPC